MFRQLATALSRAPAIPGATPLARATAAADAVLSAYRPSQLSEFLELFWSSWRNPARQGALGPNLTPAAHQTMGRPSLLDPLLVAAGGVFNPPRAPIPVQWHHLVYAYMLENTRIVDIFRRVLYEWVHGERLPTATQPTQRW